MSNRSFDAHGDIAGRETEILDALKIAWRKACSATGSVKMHCPFPDHEDKHPSWRWDTGKAKWHCTCGERSGSVFDAVIRMGQAKDFTSAAIWARKVLKLAEVEVHADPVKFCAGFGASPFADEAEPQEAPRAGHALADRPPTAEQVAHSKLGSPSRIDCYMVGTQVYEARVRYDGADGKAVLPWHWNGRFWILGAAPQPRPLYRLGELLADPGVPVLVVEGEKAVDGACDRFLDYVVTTTSGGCKQAHHTGFAAFAGRRVVVWPDNDEPGRKYAQAICRLALAAGALSTHIVDVPESWPKGWDLADELPELAPGFACTPETLRVMLNHAVAWTPPSEGPDEAAKPEEPKPSEDPASGDGLPEGLHWDEGQALPEPDWLIKGVIPRPRPSTPLIGNLVGKSGVYKTSIAIDLAMSGATGSDFFGRKVKEQFGTVYYAVEGGGSILHRMRAAKITRGMKPDAKLPVIWITDEGMKGLSLNDADGQARLVELVKKAAAEMKRRFGVRLGMVTIDTSALAFVWDDENSNAEITRNCKILKQIAGATNAFVMIVVHAGKDASRGERGGAAWRGNVDISIMATADKDEIKGDSKNHQLWQRKNRDGFEGAIGDFDPEFVGLGVDSDGDAYGARVIVPVEREKAEPKRRKKKTKYRDHFEQAFRNALIARPLRRRVNAPAGVIASEVNAVKIDYVRAEFYKICSEGTQDAKRMAFDRELVSLFKEFPQEEDPSGTRWIWSKDHEEERT